MLLAINYSPEAADLFKDRRIQLDRFKCPDWPDMVADAGRVCRVAVHFSLKAGRGNLPTYDWDLVERLRRLTGTRYVNLHLTPRGKDFPGLAVDGAGPAEIAGVEAALLADIQIAVARFGAENVIAENVPYRRKAGKTLQAAILPDVIRRVVEQTGIGLLLDISHARIAADAIGMDPYDYMNALPVGQLRELHFTGLQPVNGRLEDHLPALETDWPVLEWVLARIRSSEWSRPNMLAFEYGGVGEDFAWRSDEAVIAEQMPRLYEMVHAV
jgi:hypothetical protein